MNTNIVVTLSDGDVSLIAEAQRLMASSINKIVSSRSRRGGVSLHRNLLVAGVLFKARDVLIAVNTMTSVPVSGSPPSDKHQDQLEMMDVEDKRKSDVHSTSSPDSMPSQPETLGESMVTEGDRPSPVSGSDRLSSKVIGKENVPPPSSAATTVEFADAPVENDSSMSPDNSKHLVSACARKRRHSTSPQAPTHPTAVKSPKISTSRSSTVLDSSIPSPVTKVTQPIARTASCKSAAPVSLSTCGRTTCVNPIVYVNRVNVELTSGIGVGLVQPIFVVKVV